MENYTSTKVTNGLCFKEGKVFTAILNIMQELSVPRNGVELDKESGEVKYTYIKIGDLREKLKPLLIDNKCMLRKVESVKYYRDRKQNKFGTWMNIDVVENTYIIQSLEDASYVVGTGRGEGSDWGDSSVTLAVAVAFKNFIGNTFCLVTDDDDSQNAENLTEHIEQNTEKKIQNEKTTEKVEAKVESKITNPAIKLTPPEPTNDIVKNIDKNVDCEKDGGVPLELPNEAYKEAEKLSKPISVESIEQKEVEEKDETSNKEDDAIEESSDDIANEPIEEQESKEPTEQTVASDEEIKAYAGVICSIPSRFVNGKRFDEICNMAIQNNSEAEKAARNCITFVASHPERFKEKIPEFLKACMLAAKKFDFVA